MSMKETYSQPNPLALNPSKFHCGLWTTWIMKLPVTRNLTNTLFHPLLSHDSYEHSWCRQPAKPAWNPFFPDKSFVSNHVKFQNFPAERSVSPYWENLVFGALVDEVSWGPPSHIRCRLWKRQVPSYQLPVTWLCSLVQIVKGQNTEKKLFSGSQELSFGLHVPNKSVMAWTQFKSTM